MTTSTDNSQVWSAKIVRASETDGAMDDPLRGERTWPVWIVTVGVVMFCTVCWMGAGYVAIRLIA